jgi:hypothetical protein
VQRREREIVLRKLYGAGGAAIGRLVALLSTLRHTLAAVRIRPALALRD